MRVRFRGVAERSRRNPVQSGFLKKDAEYVVLSVNASGKLGVKLQLLADDETHEPGWFDAEDFEITSDAIPSTWRIGLRTSPYVSGELVLGPLAFLDEEFWDKYWGDGTRHLVIDEFEREVEILVREDGEASGTWI
jgi:hypothetical protein